MTSPSSRALALCLPVLYLSACSSTAPDDGKEDGDAAACEQDECTESDPIVCDEGSWDHDSNTTTACVPWTQCGPGFFATPGSATSDRGCTPCASGSFSDTSNASSCATFTDCLAGQFVLEAGSSVQDRSCDDCPSDTFSTALNSASCADIGTCAPGTRQSQAGSETSDVTCLPCDNGSFCAGGSEPPVACASGSWDHDANPASTCEPWTQCAVEESPGTTTSDAVCGCAYGQWEAWSTCDATCGDGVQTRTRVVTHAPAGVSCDDTEDSQACTGTVCKCKDYDTEGTCLAENTCKWLHGSCFTSCGQNGDSTIAQTPEYIALAEYNDQSMDECCQLCEQNTSCASATFVFTTPDVSGVCTLVNNTVIEEMEGSTVIRPYR